MSNSTVSAQECVANSTEFVIQKPCAGSNIMVDLSKDEPTAFNFAVDDVRAMKLLSDGGLMISFVDGSTLTVSNFKEARDTFPFNEIQMSDGTVVNLQQLAMGLAGTLPQDTLADLTILKPVGAQGATDLQFTLQEGKVYTLGFDMNDVAGIEQKDGDLVVSFKDGTTLTLENFEAVNAGVLPPQMTLADGSVIPAAHLVNVINVAMADQVKEVEPAAGETSSDAEAKIAAQKVAAAQADPEELAAIEPAAGEPGAGGGDAGGYGFNSAVDATNLNPLAAVGPLGITSLAFDQPQLRLNPSVSAAVAAPGVFTLNSPDRFGYEDEEINLQISANGANPADEILTITVADIPAGWTVNTALSGGTFNAGTGTWTITLPQGQNFSGGPILVPPHDSDVDIKAITGPLSVTVSAFNTVTNTTDTRTDDMNVVVDAVADKPDLAVSNVNGSDNVPLPLSIVAAVTDTDGSEVLTTATLTGIPAGHTLNHGTYDAGTQTWTVNASDLSTLTITAPAGYNGFYDVTVTVNNREANLSDEEITLVNNTNFNTQKFRVTFDDTAPIIGDSVAEVDDTGLSAGANVATGNISINFQADTPGTFGPAPANTFSSGGSQLNNTLSSNGSPVTVTLAGNTYTGTAANGTVVFTLQVNSNGQYTFTQFEQLDHADGTNPNDVISLNFVVSATDSDGDTDTGTITVNVLDDAPVAINDNFVGNNNQATGNVTTNDIFSQDTFATGTANKVHEVTFGGETKQLPLNGTNVTFTNASGTLVINANGTFTYTPPVPGQDVTFTYKLIDFDGDISTVSANNGTVTIDLNGVPTITGSSVTTDETNLDNTGTAQTVNGTYTFSYGADGAGSITATGYTGPNLTSGGVAVAVAQGPAGTFTGTAGGVTVFTMTIRNDGTYTFTQNEPLDHPNPNDHDDALNLTFGVTITDASGDTATASLTAVVRDDGPVAVNDNFVSATATATGNITANDDIGADEPGRVLEVTFGGQTVTLNADGTTNSTITNASGTLVINASGQFTFTPPVPGQGTTFTYKLIDADGDTSVVNANNGTVTIDTNGTPTITGSSVTTDDTNLSGGAQSVVGTYTFNYGGDGQGAGTITLNGYTGPALTSGGVAVQLALSGTNTMIGTANGQEVFRVVVGTNGTYTFTQSKVLDHPDATNPNDALNLTFGIRITDADGTAATSTITAVVLDDGPVAVNDTFLSSTTTASGNITDNDDKGEDLPGRVYDVTFGGQTVVLNADGVTNSTITNASGTLVINASGQFTYTPPVPGGGATFTYRLIDFDGDLSTVSANNGTVTVDTDSIPVIGNERVNTDETSLIVGPSVTNGSIMVEYFGDGPGTLVLNNTFSSTGSKLAGNLSSNGSPVSVTIAGSTYTGKDALGNTVFTLQVNQNGTYTFTQFEQLDHADGSNPNDIITLNFGVTGTDADGDTDTGTITVDVRDDAPAALDDVINLVGNTATGNVFDNDTPGQDTPVPVTQVTYGATTYTVPANGSNLTIVAAHGTLVINKSGAYTYTSNNSAGTDSFNYRIVDFDGDSATANLSLTTSDIDYVPVVGDSSGTVDETGLSPVSVSGQVTADYLNDGPGSISATNTFSSSGSKLGGQLTSNGSLVTVTLAGNTYTGKDALGNTVFTLSVQSNGAYTYTQFRALDHADSNNANDVINLNFTVVGTDADGDTDTGTITINVLDDAPVAVNDTLSVSNVTPATGNLLSNDDLSTDTPNLVTQIVFNNVTYTVPANGSNTTVTGTFGTLVINNTGAYTYTSKNTAEGTDVFTYTVRDHDQDPATATFTATVTDINTTPIVTTTTTTVDESGTKVVNGTITADFGDDGPGSYLVCSGQNFSSDGSKLNGNLTSSGVAVNVTSTASGYIGTANGQTVFTLTLAANGSYTFSLLKPLDHANPNDPNDIINLNFQVCAKDADGSVGHGTLTIKVVDDAPVANNDTAIYCVDDWVHNGNLIDGYHASNGSAGVDNATSFDNPTWLYSITGPNGTQNIPVNGAASIEGQYGTLLVFSDGSYVYAQKVAGSHTESFTYLLKDGDGDTEAATFTISSVPRGSYTNSDWIVANGTTQGTDTPDILVAYNAGVADNMYGNGGNDVIFGYSGNDNIFGGAGNDVLYGEYGGDNLWGGAGTDMFVAERTDLDGGYLGTFTDRVKDFNASEGDVLDLSSLIDNPSGAQAAINDYVRADVRGGDTMLQVRTNGAGAWKDAMLVENHTSLDVQTLLNNGNLDVT